MCLTFSTVGFNGRLTVSEPKAFSAALLHGTGHAKPSAAACCPCVPSAKLWRYGLPWSNTVHTLTADELNRQPAQLIADAQRGEPAIVTVDGEPVMLAFPLIEGIDSQAVLTDLAATLFDRERIGLSLAARIAGLSYSEMIDELGRRGIAVIRLTQGELERELAAFGA